MRSSAPSWTYPQKVIGLDILAAHLFGDFVLQVWRIPTEKLGNWRIRLIHVAVYTLCFLPVAALHTTAYSRICAFLGLLAAAHFITDSRRWASGATWPPRPILVDQALHVLQLAVFSRLLTGGVFAMLSSLILVAVLALAWCGYEITERQALRVSRA